MSRMMSEIPPHPGMSWPSTEEHTPSLHTGVAWFGAIFLLMSIVLRAQAGEDERGLQRPQTKVGSIFKSKLV